LDRQVRQQAAASEEIILGIRVNQTRKPANRRKLMSTDSSKKKRLIATEEGSDFHTKPARPTRSRQMDVRQVLNWKRTLYIYEPFCSEVR
jgi:hypothetical protein